MTHFHYDLAKKEPQHFSKMILPSRFLEVRRDMKNPVYCTSAIGVDGLVTIDIPDELIERLQAGTSILRVRTQSVPENLIGDSGKSQQPSAIDILDVA